MKSHIEKSVLPAVTLSLLISSLAIPENANAEKVVGTCKADIAGAHPFTISGKLYEGMPPEKTIQSVASTRAWTLKAAEEYRPLSATLADQRKHLAETLTFVLSIACISEKGTVQLQPYDGTAKAADYPDGPRVFRLVGSNMRDRKSGDMSAFVLSQEFTTGMIEPAEPGELKIIKSDGDKLVATFSFKSKTYSVTGSVDFTRPKEVTK